MITNDGRFVAAFDPAPTSNNGRILTGSGTISGNQLSASGTGFTSVAFPSGSFQVPVILTGSVATNASISGSYSGGGESGSFSLGYQALTNRPSSIATVGGTYTGLPSVSANESLNSNNGVLFFTSPGCVGNGTIGIVDSTKNTYTWAMQIIATGQGSCIYAGNQTGLAYLADTNSTTTNNIIVMIGSAGTTNAFVFVGAK
jgi:hypothetical protein